MQAESNTNPHDALRARVRAVLAREGMTQRELARRVGYSPTALNLWLTGRYDRDDSRIAERLTVELDAIEQAHTPAHPADVRASLEKRGLSLAALARAHGCSASLLSAALRRPHARAEAIIAAALDESPSKIWPDRYDAFGHHVSDARRAA